MRWRAAATRWIVATCRDREHWWLFVFLGALSSYIMLLRAYAIPGVVPASVLKMGPPRLLASLDGPGGLDGCLWRDDHLLFSQPWTNRLWRHEEGRGLVRIGHSFFLGAAGCQDDCDAMIPGTVCAVETGTDDLILCEQGSRRLTSLGVDGSRTVLAEDVDANEAVVVNDTIYYIHARNSTTGSSRNKGGNYFAASDDAKPNGLYKVGGGLVEEFEHPEALAVLGDNTTLLVGDGDKLYSYRLDLSKRGEAMYAARSNEQITSVAVSEKNIFVAAGPSITVLPLSSSLEELGHVTLEEGAFTSVAVGKSDGHLYMTTSKGELLYSLIL